jgi:hypothetical protein
MQRILLNQAGAGMVIADEITGVDGKVLAPAGSLVDDAMLRQLEHAGVTKLVVEGKPVPGATMGYDARERADRLEHLFRAHQNDSFMTALQELLHKHFQSRA